MKKLLILIICSLSVTLSLFGKGGHYGPLEEKKEAFHHEMRDKKFFKQYKDLLKGLKILFDTIDPKAKTCPGGDSYLRTLKGHIEELQTLHKTFDLCSSQKLSALKRLKEKIQHASQELKGIEQRPCNTQDLFKSLGFETHSLSKKRQIGGGGGLGIGLFLTLGSGSAVDFFGQRYAIVSLATLYGKSIGLFGQLGKTEETGEISSLVKTTQEDKVIGALIFTSIKKSEQYEQNHGASSEYNPKEYTLYNRKNIYIGFGYLKGQKREIACFIPYGEVDYFLFLQNLHINDQTAK